MNRVCFINMLWAIWWLMNMPLNRQIRCREDEHGTYLLYFDKVEELEVKEHIEDSKTKHFVHLAIGLFIGATVLTGD
jgi:hypothetical protein